MHELRIKVQHDCPHLVISEFLDTEMYSYCSSSFDLIVIPGKLEDNILSNITGFLEKRDISTLEVTRCGDNKPLTYIYTDCIYSNHPTDDKNSRFISKIITDAGGMIEYPVIYEDGWEHYKIVCLNKKIVSDILKDLENEKSLVIIGLTDLGDDGLDKTHFFSMPELIKQLTDRQLQVIVNAYENGYYSIPRGVKMQEIAEKYNVSRPAIEKSLRKAENKIMEMIVPYLFFHYRAQESK
ncbi:MAG: hypothetical protein GPJ54_19675 [Candidatus Heimdallarchaeota archaeon]|nr:hypothetical protein [Candidatus Heimdallarchaeota archaeon]